MPLRGALPKRLGHDEEASLVEHLTELRTRIIICLVTVAAVFCVLFFGLRHDLIDWLAAPLGDRPKPITLSPSEPFMTSFNICFWTALAISLPVVLWQAWAFLAPAFSVRSEHSVVKLVTAAMGLLALGMAFAYWVVLPTSLNFLLNFDAAQYNIQIRASDYYGFAALMIFTIGLVFELPLFMIGLVRLGILSSDTLRANRRIGYGIVIVIAVALPGVDFVTMTVQTVPLVILYEASIWAAVVAERRMGAPDPAPGPV
jgi:sec-independent protein translocase protein TatC